MASLGKAADGQRTVAILRVFSSWAVDVEANALLDQPLPGRQGVEYARAAPIMSGPTRSIARFEAAYPLGTRERLAYALLLYTGQRSGDSSAWAASTSGTAGLAIRAARPARR